MELIIYYRILDLETPYIIGKAIRFSSLVVLTSDELSWLSDTCEQQSRPHLHGKQLNHILAAKTLSTQTETYIPNIYIN